MKTFTPGQADIQREWHVIDAEGAVLGRLATEVATLLRGKHKPIWAPHLDTGDHVIVVNAALLDVSARKAVEKQYYRHSDRKSTRLNSSHIPLSRMPSSA